MSDSHDELAEIANLFESRVPAAPGTRGDAPDPVASFGSTVEHALEQLAHELAGIRAERDGLRREIEGLRAELELVRAQLDDRERFTSAVRELGEVVRSLDVPVEWRAPEADLPAAPATRPTPVAAPPEVVFDVVAEVVEAPEPDERSTKRRRGWFRKTLTVVGGIIAALVVLIVLLISVGPKVAPYETYFVKSGSMEPTFEKGDLIVLGKVDASEVEKGDIITFERPDKPDTLVTHRVVAIETTADGKQFQTKGDANERPDGWRVPASGKAWKYEFRVSKLGYVFDFLSEPGARIALVAVPVVLLGALWLTDIRKRRRAPSA